MKRLEVDAAPLDGTVLVQASAGTGKTYTISHLYLRALLELRLEPRQVLVVTYTKAATAELRGRLRTRLGAALAALVDGRTADAVLETWLRRRRAEGMADADAAHLRLCLHEIDSAAIHTIHAFGQRALLELPFASRADFAAELLEDTGPLIERTARDFWAARLFAAEPALVAYLQEEAKLGPEVLARLGQRVVHQPGVSLLPASLAVDPAAGAHYAAVAAEWTESWRASCDEIQSLLLETDALHRNKYRVSSIRRWCEQLDAEAALSQPAPSWRVDKFEKFTPQGLREGCRAGRSAPSHPFFETCARLAEAQAALVPWATALQLEFARSLSDSLAQRLQRFGLRSFGDLISLLRDALCDPVSGARLTAELRRRYPVALIDESQDTDPIQGEIFARVWADAGLPLFLIGDPKQAIYSFRGADVRAYVAAGRAAREVYTLDESWRSDPRLLLGIDALFRAQPLPFAPESIDYRPLIPRPGAHDALEGPAFELLVVEPAEPTIEAAETAVCSGVAAEIEALLTAEPRPGALKLRARDVSVLCRTNLQARRMRDALRACGVPAVLHGDESVFDGEAAAELERVARSLADPGDAVLLRAALATRLLGQDARSLDQLAHAGSGFERWIESVQLAHARWLHGGFAIALRVLLDQCGAAERLLSEPGGERSLTDVLHVAELMHIAERQLHLGPRALVRWLADQRRGLGPGMATLVEDAQLRLESDGDCVQLTTVHRSKGLEYGVVYVPFAWGDDGLRRDDERWPRFHDGDALALDVGSERLAANQTAAEAEARAEAMRLLYVAVTRAKHRCSVVYAPAKQSHASALGRLLGCEAGEVGAPLLSRLAKTLGAEAAIAVRALAPSTRPALPAPRSEPTPGAPRRLSRAIGRARRTSSFSALVRGAPIASEGRDHDAGLESEPEGAVSARAFPAGAAVGLALHEVLEHLDFPAAESEGVSRAVERASALHGIAAEHGAALVRCVLDALDTCLPPEGVLRLRDVVRAQRLSELEFLVPVGDARSAQHWLRPDRLAQPFARFAARSDLRSYAERVQRLRFADVAGHLRGFVDLVFRYAGRWYLVDYKSNNLGEGSDAYAPERLGVPMREHDYLLQYHLYTLALHRWLAQRVPGYQYERDFGGVYYLFLRGMGPAYPLGSGVWFDQPPLALIEGLSAALTRPGERSA